MRRPRKSYPPTVVRSKEPAAESQCCHGPVLPLAGEDCRGTRKSWSAGWKHLRSFACSSKFFRKKKCCFSSEIVIVYVWNCLHPLCLGFCRLCFVFCFSVLGELCGARIVPPAADGFCLHSALHFYWGVPVEASCITSHFEPLVVFANHWLNTLPVFCPV